MEHEDVVWRIVGRKNEIKAAERISEHQREVSYNKRDLIKFGDLNSRMLAGAGNLSKDAKLKTISFD